MKKYFSIFTRNVWVPIIKNYWIKEINGLENIPKEKNFIIAANHQTFIDHIFVGLPIKDRLEKAHFIGKLESFSQILMWGWFYWLADTIPIDRKSQDKRKVLDKAVEALKKGEIIIIYPEGHRNKNKELLTGKTGVAELTMRSQVPVIPMGIIYKDHKPPKFPVIINIGKPLIFSEDLNRDNLRKVTDEIMKEIASLSEKIYVKNYV